MPFFNNIYGSVSRRNTIRPPDSELKPPCNQTHLRTHAQHVCTIDDDFTSCCGRARVDLYTLPPAEGGVDTYKKGLFWFICWLGVLADCRQGFLGAHEQVMSGYEEWIKFVRTCCHEPKILDVKASDLGETGEEVIWSPDLRLRRPVPTPQV